MVALFFIAMFTPPLLWLFSIRPYCRRHGKGYTPGANVAVTFWVDWQEAWELAKECGDSGMVTVCRLVLILKIVVFGALVMALMGG